MIVEQLCRVACALVLKFYLRSAAYPRVKDMVPFAIMVPPGETKTGSAGEVEMVNLCAAQGALPLIPTVFHIIFQFRISSSPGLHQDSYPSWV